MVISSAFTALSTRSPTRTPNSRTPPFIYTVFTRSHEVCRRSRRSTDPPDLNPDRTRPCPPATCTWPRFAWLAGKRRRGAANRHRNAPKKTRTGYVAAVARVVNPNSRSSPSAITWTCPAANENGAGPVRQSTARHPTADIVFHSYVFHSLCRQTIDSRRSIFTGFFSLFQLPKQPIVPAPYGRVPCTHFENGKTVNRSVFFFYCFTGERGLDQKCRCIIDKTEIVFIH